jgi:hypothetical protein
MTQKEKEEARRLAMEYQRERHEFGERHNRLHPTAVPMEGREPPAAEEESE